MTEGWIAIHRAIQNWEWWGDPVMVRVWLQMLFDANISPQTWKGMVVGRGQLVFGRKAYAEKCGISERTMRTVLTRLKTTGEVTITSTNQFSLVTIARYEEYQSPLKETTSKTTSKPSHERPTNDQQTTTLEQRNNKSILNYLPETPGQMTPKSTFRSQDDTDEWQEYYRQFDKYIDAKKRGDDIPRPRKPGESA